MAMAEPPRHPGFMTRLALLLVLLLPTAAQAQDAAALADRVEAFYRDRPAMRVSFEQHHWSRDYRRTTSSRGTLEVLRPRRFRLEYTNGLVDVCDGRELVHYEPGDGTWPGQYHRARASELPHWFAYLTDGAPLDRDYVVSIPARVFGDPAPVDTDVIELVPRSEGPHVRRIWLFVSHAAGSEGRIERVSIESQGRDWNHFHFGAPTFEAIDAGRFDFTPPEGAREITPPGT